MPWVAWMTNINWSYSQCFTNIQIFFLLLESCPACCGSMKLINVYGQWCLWRELKWSTHFSEDDWPDYATYLKMMTIVYVAVYVRVCVWTTVLPPLQWGVLARLEWDVSEIIIKWATLRPAVPWFPPTLLLFPVFPTLLCAKSVAQCSSGELNSLPGNGKIMWKQVSTTVYTVYTAKVNVSQVDKIMHPSTPGIGADLCKWCLDWKHWVRPTVREGPQAGWHLHTWYNGTWYLILGTWYLTPKYLILGLVHGTWYLSLR